MTLAELRAAIAANLGVLEGVTTSAYMLGDPKPPFAWVRPDETQYDRAMGRGMDEWHLVVQAYVGTLTDQGAQVLLDRMIDPASGNSVKEALEADKTLGGLVDALHVVSCTGYRTYPRPDGTSLLGAEWAITVYAPGN